MGLMLKKCTDDRFVTNEHVVQKVFHRISVRTVTADINFVPTDGAEAKVVCCEDAKMEHCVEVQDDALVIDGVVARKWYHYIGFPHKKAKIKIFIPGGEYKNLTVKNTTGDVNLPEGFKFGNAEISVTTGNVHLAGIQCDSLTSTGTTGNMSMKDVIAAGKITIRRITGHVELDACDAAELFIKVTTGHVEGTLLSDKTFEAKATTGKVDVPKSRPGGLCKVITTTGHVEIDIQS